MSRRFVAVVSFPGAARAIAPVARALLASGWDGRVVASEVAAPIVRRAGVPDPIVFPVEQPEVALAVTPDAGAVLLAGVSEGNTAEKHVLAQARRDARPSCVVLDAWGRYRERILGTFPEDARPSVLAVMNERARIDIEAARFFDGELVVSGHPGLDELLASDMPAPTERERARARLGLDTDTETIVFFSQPIAQHFGRSLGYTQRDALDALTHARPDGAAVVVALHPRDSREAVDGVAPGVAFLDEYEPETLFRAADVVASAFSATLTEAVLAWRPAMSVQPGLSIADPCWTNEIGATTLARSVDDVPAALAAARSIANRRGELADRRERLGLPPGATNRVAAIMERLACR